MTCLVFSIHEHTKCTYYYSTKKSWIFQIMDFNKAFDYRAMFTKGFANKQILVYCTLFPVPGTVLSNWIQDRSGTPYKTTSNISLYDYDVLSVQIVVTQYLNTPCNRC